MKIAFYGSSLLSSYWNGAATYYRGILEELAKLGHEITFYEPDAFDRQSHRDIDPPSWARVVVYPATDDGVARVIDAANAADVIVKASGVGVFDDLLAERLLGPRRPGAVRVFWDVDAPATLAEMASDAHPLRRLVPNIDLVLTYGGGEPVVSRYLSFGARQCVPVYNGLTPSTHHPAAAEDRFTADLSFLGNRLPDREQRVESFFLEPAARLKRYRFILGGAGWEARPLPLNVHHIGHVPTRDHNAFNVSARAVLNIARDSMAETGFSPATRVFEACGAGACLITDDWVGIDHFFAPNREILVARDGRDIDDILTSLTNERARQIGRNALERVLRDHTYARRAALAHTTLVEALERARATANASDFASCA